MAYRDSYVDCKKCGLPCVWMKTYSGKSILVDRASFNGEEIYDKKVNTCHWESCGKPTSPVRERNLDEEFKRHLEESDEF